VSSFSGLSTALSSLMAQRQALDVSGQNIANANTKGYTRQRVDMQSIQALTAPTMFSSQIGAGTGVKVVGIERLGDIYLDARVRAETAASSYTSTRADALARLQTTVTEPSDTGFASTLQTFWAGWQDVANHPEDPAARKVLIGAADNAIKQMADGYRAVETQWTQARTSLDTLTTEVNTTAQAVAHLNEQIRSILVSGGSASELMDQRDQMITSLSGLVGAQARQRDDGTIDVMVGGNALVRGVEAREIRADGGYTMGGTVSLVWAGTAPPQSIGLEGGALAATLESLAPANGTGTGGSIAEAAQRWNQIADALADTVNTAYAAGGSGDAFFDQDPLLPAAVGLSVGVAAEDIVAGAPGAGPLDGSIADAISQTPTTVGGAPDELWAAFVVDLGVQTRSAQQRAGVTEAARATAENLQLSQASVDLDEEMVNMLAYQRAYEGAARVMTAIDEMLDVLINRTGVVGR